MYCEHSAAGNDCSQTPLLASIAQASVVQDVSQQHQHQQHQLEDNDFNTFGHCGMYRLPSTLEPVSFNFAGILLTSYLVCCLLLQSTNLDGRVDGTRIGLWGVSYSGGHVLVTAAKFGRNVSVVVANVSVLCCQWLVHLTLHLGSFFSHTSSS